MIARARRTTGRHGGTLVLFAGLALGAASPPGFAAEAVERGSQGVYKVDREADGGVHVLRTLAPVCFDAASPEDAARHFLASEGSFLGLPADLKGIELLQVQESLTGFHVRYAQTVDGLPVWQSALVVHLDRERCVVKVDRFLVFDGPVASEAVLGEADAADVARAALVTVPVSDKRGSYKSGLADVSEVVLRDAPQVSRIVVAEENGKGGRLAYLVSLRAENPHGLWEVAVDASSGAVLGRRNLMKYAVDGTGQVYEKANACVALQNPSLQDMGDADAAVPAGAYATKTLNQLNNPVGGIFKLEGQFVQVKELDPPVVAPPTSATSSFIFTRSPDEFEAVNAYFHIDRTQRYIQTLGFTNIFASSIRIDVHGFNGQDNSFYSDSPQGAGFISMGDGGVDDAEDADVFVHEYGHAIHHNQVLGWSGSCEGGGMGEGFGDYLAGTMHEEWNFDNACIMMWDATAYRAPAPPNPCLRRMDCTVPGGSCGRAGGWVWNGCTEVHDDGEIWSQALWNCRLGIGRDAFNRVLLESHFSVPPGNGSYRDAVLAIFDADNQLNGCANCPTICSVMIARGYITNADCPGARCDLQSHTIDDAAPRGDGDGVAEPGESLLMPVTLQNTGTLPLTNVNATLTSDQPGFITITQNTSSYGSMALGASRVSLTSYAWSVAPNTPCGTVVNFTLNITSTEWTGTATFSETLGRPLPPLTGSYLGPAIAIPDDNTTGISSTITMAAAGNVTGVSCTVAITHTWRGDLDVILVSPTGTQVTLHSSATDPADDVDDIRTTYPVPTAPDGPGAMTDFIGQPIAGGWRLRVADRAAQDTGTLDSWSLAFATGFQCGPGGGCATAAALNDVKAVKLLPARTSARLSWTGSADACHASYKVYRSTVPGMRPSPPPGTWPTNPLFTDISASDLDTSNTNASFDWTPGAVEFLKVIDVGTDGREGPNGSF